MPGPPAIPGAGAPAAPSLWDLALAKLLPEDQQQLRGLDKLDALGKALEAAIEKRNQCYKKQWTYNWKGEKVILRDVADKLVAWINKFASIGNVVASFDPTHAALPWAGFRFFLQVSPCSAGVSGVMLMIVACCR